MRRSTCCSRSGTVRAMWSSAGDADMGPIVDRTKENLSSSDVAVAQTRRLILDTIAAYQAGALPPGSARSAERVRIPEPFDAVLDAGESWLELQPAT